MPAYYPYAFLFLAAVLLSIAPLPLAVALSLGLIAIIGIPHGASDYLIARERYRARFGRLSMAVFFSAYLAIAALCLGIWLMMPVLALSAFLVLSAWHFAQSDRPAQEIPMTGVERLGRGLMPIAGPTLLFGDRVADIFLVLTPGADAGLVVGLTDLLQPLGLVALFALVIAAAKRWQQRQNWQVAELATLAVLPLLAPPLASFALYFAFIHSLRQIEKRKTQLRISSTRVYLQKTWLLSFGGIVVMAICGLNAASLPDAAISGVFIGLACLTVPHAILVPHD